MKNRLKKMFEYIHSQPLKGLGRVYRFCIAVALVLNLLHGLYTFVAMQTGRYKCKNLSLNDFEIINGEAVNEMYLINQTDDTQLIYTGAVKKLKVKCTFSFNPGEFNCFYNSSGDGVFGTHKMEYARLYGDYYVFKFPHGVKQIRLDTGIFRSNQVDFEEIVINDLSPADIFALSGGELFSLLFLPAVFFIVLDTLGKILFNHKNN